MKSIKTLGAFWGCVRVGRSVERSIMKHISTGDAYIIMLCWVCIIINEKLHTRALPIDLLPSKLIISNSSINICTLPWIIELLAMVKKLYICTDRLIFVIWSNIEFSNIKNELSLYSKIRRLTLQVLDNLIFSFVLGTIFLWQQKKI